MNICISVWFWFGFPHHCLSLQWDCLKCSVRFKSLFCRDFADPKPVSSLLCCSLGTASQSSPVSPSFPCLGIINPIPDLMESLRLERSSRMSHSSPAACGSAAPHGAFSPFILMFYSWLLLAWSKFGIYLGEVIQPGALSAPWTDVVLCLGKYGEISFIPGPYVK